MTSKITPWEKILRQKDDPSSGYFIRIGDSHWGVSTYRYGFVVAKLSTYDKRGTLSYNMSTYPNTIEGLAKTVSELGHSLYGADVPGLTEAIQGRIKAQKFAVQLTKKIEELVDNA